MPEMFLYKKSKIKEKKYRLKIKKIQFCHVGLFERVLAGNFVIEFEKKKR
ncbi:MAG: hypothetical protein WC770_04240 [Phycisphaerae bacterium]|jgi:hypothetical protein